MPRVKPSGQIEALERQQKELLEKLKAAKAKARLRGREQRTERARIAGLAFLDELDANPSGDAAAALLACLNARLTRRADREAFGLGMAAVSTSAANSNSVPESEAISAGASPAE